MLAALLDLPYGLFVKLLGACSRLPPGLDTTRRRRRGLVIVLGGVEGPSFFNARIVHGLVAGRLRGAIRRIDWNDGIPFIRSAVNLMSRPHHEHWARIVADQIAAHRAAYRDAPVAIVSQSGGCWIAIRALELLPESCRITTAVLHAPAVSPQYDLRPAAARCERAIVSVEAIGDYVLLGAGTIIAGTADRRHTPAAGLVGWKSPPAKLISLRWRPAWLRRHHLGNHTTSAARRFVRDVITPRL